uniref:TIR domain-containing protein n=1 Tax=Caenorhabditis japonica TaxID=281687 RepID=A0A8R1HZI2_CAEJA
MSAESSSFEMTEDVLMPLARLEKFSLTESRHVELPLRLLCSLPHLQVLNLSSNSLPTLRREESCVAQQLLIVDVSRNQLSSIEQFVRGVPAIRQISVAHNLIAKLELATSTPFLQQLDAEQNKIETLESLPDTVVHVNLAGNLLKTIPVSVAALANLVALNVSRNAIELGNFSVLASPELEMLDASYNRLTTLPSEWLERCEKRLAHLHLEHNRIEQLPVGTLSNATNLQTLDLSSNLLRVFAEDVLPNGSKINALRLANNSLETLEPHSLDGLKLETLDLSHNQLTEVPAAMGKVEQLKRVDLSHNNIGKLYQYMFNKIKQLHTVDLSSNQLQSVGPYIFSDSSELHFLDVSSNEISLLFKDAFARCPKLRKISMRDNKIKSLDEGLTEASGLRRLDVSENAIVVLKWSTLPENLEFLNADKNDINLLTAALKSNLKTVSLSRNKITVLNSEQIPKTVESFDIAHNRLSRLGKATLADKSQLRRLNLSHNQLTVVPTEAVRVMESIHPVKISIDNNPLECSCQSTWFVSSESEKKKEGSRVLIEDRHTAKCSHAVDGRIISLDRIQKKDLLCSYQSVCEPECICCQYGNCDCKSVCPSSCRCFRDDTFNINIVRCEHNETIVPKREFVVSELPVSATEIILSGVVLPQLRTHSFIGRLRLQRLHINGTGLRSIQSKAFHTLPSLKTLDLSDNSLLSLTGDEFLKTSEVAQLFLNGNRFSTLSRGIFEKLPNLKFLTLHNNSFEDIPPVLSNVASLSGISLSSNPLRCDCGVNVRHYNTKHNPYAAPIIEHNAAEWMSVYRHLVVDAAKVECRENVTKAFMINDTTILSAYPPNVDRDIFVMPMDTFLRDYNVSICVPYSSGFFGQDPQNSVLFVLAAVAIAILLCILVILAISFVRKSHDAINQRRYKASSLNCSTSAGSSPLPIPLLSYHAFVSYSKKDEKMVIDQLCRPLEDEDYQLCLLHRDGPTYNSNLHAISDELIAQMDSSQCLILVLTKHFLENEWKTLQIKTSHQLFAKNRAKRVIAVLGEGVDANLLDDELGQILRKHTRIEMRSHLFWTLLHSSLPSRLPLPPHDDSSQLYSDIYGIVPSDVV